MGDQEYERYWHTVVETMQDGLMVVDDEGIIVSVNPALERLTGYQAEELIGQPCSILECDTCLAAQASSGEKFCELFTKGEIRRCRCRLKTKDGQPLFVLKNAAVLTGDDGRVRGGVETLTDLSEVKAREDEVSQLQRELGVAPGFEGMVGKSALMQNLFTLIKSAADSDAPVLIHGESGTGKELVTAAIHRLGPRRAGPLISVNCAALNQNLLESELFGHVKGAFTGADRQRLGRFEVAHGGVLFLDEIGDLPLPTQVKLLRVLQEKVIERVGDHRPIPVDVRFICATNKDLKAEIAAENFREDLYYRISVIPIRVPPLRERIEDIPLLADTFVKRIGQRTKKEIKAIGKSAMDRLIAYSWPGNVRELINAIEYAFVLCQGQVIGPRHLPHEVSAGAIAPPHPAESSENFGVREDRQKIIAALRQAGGKKIEAARILGISRVTLWKRLKEYGIETRWSDA
jgi:PAS domain S-box-containing protein